MNLYYLHYNNYYNRIIKKFDNLSDYLVSPYYDNVVTENIAFNPNDGVTTKQVANIPINNTFTYDYCIYAEGNEIVSRWFIIDAKRNLNGQYTLNLKRDLFADSLDEILDAPSFIEKATLNPTDPLIFNSEDMTFNQIKTSETLLKDNSGCPWIVGYLDNKVDIQDANVKYEIPTSYTTRDIFETDWNSLKSTDPNVEIMVPTDYTLKVFVDKNQEHLELSIKSYASQVFDTGTTTNLRSSDPTSAARYYQSRFAEIVNTAKTFYNYQTNESVNKILEYNGKIIKDTENDKYYKISIKVNSAKLLYNFIGQNSGSMYAIINSITTSNPYVTGSDTQLGTYTWTTSYSEFTYTLTEVFAKNISYSINASNVNNLQDAPYTMFAIPYGEIFFNVKDGSQSYRLHLEEENAKSMALSIAKDISKRLSGDGAGLYDIQLLPYCPFQNEIVDNKEITFEYNTYFSFINDSNNNKVGLICFPIQSKFEFNIPYEVEISNYKIESQCDMYRLCSPNWNGQFEFNAAKNGGIASINVDCEYKPYQPYIHLNPNFSRLYGQDFNDARGLICSGDFSLTQSSNAWATYERQNVNFQKTFDRQIQNMEVNNALQNIKTATQAALGTAGGVVGGLLSGGIGGAIIGGTASAIGGAMDYALQKSAQAEAIDYTKDQFGYSLGNIKALPDSLTKVSAINNNNKLFPVMEYYTCTEEEKEALRNKIKYNGMTVMRIGTIREFLKNELTYIKGKIIRLENFNEDFHYVNELANEFNKGVFI